MTGDRLAVSRQPYEDPSPLQREIPKSQGRLYDFLLEIVKTWSPEDVLEEFKQLFLYQTNTTSAHLLPTIYQILISNQEQEFRNTLKRSCYILVNNWELARNHQAIQQLVQLFSDPILYKSTVSPNLKRLREWLRNFVGSQDFQELKLFVNRFEKQTKERWSDRYTSYLLVPQYIDLDNSFEQRQAARSLYKKLKERFKFDLAMYTAYSQSAVSREYMPKNPTALGDEVLHLIKRILVKRGFFNYSNLARIFLNQTQNLSYRDFKRSLLVYLTSASDHHPFADRLKNRLAEKLNALYCDHDDKAIDHSLLLRTSNRVIDYLTTEHRQDPSPLFALLIAEANPLLLVIVLLRLIMICGYSRSHLEVRIADLIRFYEKYPEEECQWIIHFMEIFNITLTIYTENIQYNLVAMAKTTMTQAIDSPLETYRIFSQIKNNSFSNADPDLELAALEDERSAFAP
ncbi:MAG: hypothetical protein HC769_16120 [Cyanobacteria bacterium CRU_2_1]|nr:hypothetical protein [Cyanobacteria bacterium RU_5_0]NJR60223.1 hypothetical protein [Cyanobacteria bacterium CRU_2_1]